MVKKSLVAGNDFVWNKTPFDMLNVLEFLCLVTEHLPNTCSTLSNFELVVLHIQTFFNEIHLYLFLLSALKNLRPLNIKFVLVDGFSLKRAVQTTKSHTANISWALTCGTIRLINVQHFIQFLLVVVHGRVFAFVLSLIIITSIDS